MTKYCPICNMEILGSKWLEHVDKHTNRNLLLIIINELAELNDK